MVHDLLEEAVHAGQGELEDHRVVGAVARQPLEDALLHPGLDGLLVGGLDIHLGLEDRHQAGVEHLLADVELLVEDGGDAFGVVGLDDRALLGAEDALGPGLGQQLGQARDRLHHLHAVGLVLKALVDLQERHHGALVPQIGGGRDAVDLAVHRLLEEDRAEDAVVERGGLDDSGAHLVHQVEHLVLVGPLVLGDAVQAQGLGGGASGLVQSGDEALALGHQLCLLGVHTGPFVGKEVRTRS